jgi:hypothetical protein
MMKQTKKSQNDFALQMTCAAAFVRAPFPSLPSSDRAGPYTLVTGIKNRGVAAETKS